MAPFCKRVWYPDRRRVLLGGGAALAVALADRAAHAQPESPPPLAQTPDHILRIEPVTLDLAPGKRIRTTGFSGMVPGPTLRLQEGRPVTMEVINATNAADIVHWHGLLVPSDVDGAPEEGTPTVPPGQSRRYSFTPRPTGTRWYHTHTRAGHDLGRGLYTAEYGFLIVEPAHDPGRYDREVLLAAHHWEPTWAPTPSSKQSGSVPMGKTVDYALASLNDKMLGHGAPIQVRAGERVLFRLLNASATKSVDLALPGHEFLVVALDGNPVPRPGKVKVLSLAVAERADVIVHMNNPGVWTLGSIQKSWRDKGLGVVIEYAGKHGSPTWSDPGGHKWDYAQFGSGSGKPQLPPDGILTLDIEMTPPEADGINRWLLNGKSFPNGSQLHVEEGKRYRLVLNNKSDDNHPFHMHRHTFELTNIGGHPSAGVMKDTVSIPKQKTSEIEFIANDPGLTLMHCHQQDHMDFGFMALMDYNRRASAGSK